MSSKNVVRWRQRARERLRQAFGNKCGICGYDRWGGNLVLHHLVPEEKSFSFNAFQSKAWAALCAEARKCVLLCHNCHGEVHAGLTHTNCCPRFDEQYANYKGDVAGRSS